MSEPTHKELRVVKLLEILEQDTDSEHPIATNSLLRQLVAEPRICAVKVRQCAVQSACSCCFGGGI